MPLGEDLSLEIPPLWSFRCEPKPLEMGERSSFVMLFICISPNCVPILLFHCVDLSDCCTVLLVSSTGVCAALGL